MYWLANPGQFVRFARQVTPWIVGLALVLLSCGLILALWISPPDYRQGEMVRVMYVHVPAAWMALMVYAGMVVGAVVGLVWRHPLADLMVLAAAPVGASFTLLCLVTGSLWGAPTWGTWWIWDARLTSVLILLFLYLGYMALVRAFDDPTRAARVSNILVVVGAINLPVIKFSVDWWHTLHQPASISVLRGIRIDPSMLTPLMVMMAGFIAYTAALLLIRLRSEITARKLQCAVFTKGVECERDIRPTGARSSDNFQ